MRRLHPMARNMKPGVNLLRPWMPLFGQLKKHTELFCPFFGQEHKQGRLELIDVCHRICEAQLAVFPLHFSISAWDSMTYRYFSDVTDGVRRIMRMLPGTVRKTEFRRNALTPGPLGSPRWDFPTAFLMGHRTGYGRSTAISEAEEEISKSE